MCFLESRLQKALNATEEFLRPTGLKLSPNKSELAIFVAGKCYDRTETKQTVEIKAGNGTAIPHADTIKILGLSINACSSHNTEALKRLERSTHNFARGISRIASKRAGLLEDNIMKAYHAFLVSHVAYAAPFLNWRRAELNKIFAQSSTASAYQHKQ